MSTQEVNDDISPFNRVIVIKNRCGNSWYTGNGTIIGNNNILTTVHLVYNKSREGYGFMKNQDKSRGYIKNIYMLYYISILVHQKAFVP